MIGLLTDRECQRKKHDGRKSAMLLHDGGSLYLRIRTNNGRAWIWRYRDKKERGGRVREMGLGSYPETSLAQARRKAAALRQEHANGIPLIETKHQKEMHQRGVPTFAEAITDYLSWRGLKGSSLVEWQTTLRLHTRKIHAYRVDMVEPEDVADALRDVWAVNSSAPRILNRVKEIFSRERALRHCKINPASWDIQKHLLGRPGKKGAGHKALPWEEIPDFMAKLRATDGPIARAFEFMILTAARASEVVGETRKKGRAKPPMTWAEIDLANRLWVVPADRIKAGKEHRVPLSDRAVEILVTFLPDHGQGENSAVEIIGCPPDHGAVDNSLASSPDDHQVNSPVFPIASPHNSIFSRLLKRLGADAVPHGFRSSFRGFCAENGVEDRLAEFALAHSLPNKVEAAYMKTTRVAERAVVMQRWSDYCAGIDTGATVVQLRA